MKRFSRALCPPTGWRSVHPDGQNQLHLDLPNQFHKTAAIAEATRSSPGGPCQQPMVRDGQCYEPPPPPRWPHKPLWPRRWCHNQQSLKASPWLLCWGLWRLHNPCRGTIFHQSLLVSQLKRPTLPAHMRLWDLHWQWPDWSNTPPQGRSSWTWAAALLA